MLLLLLLTPEFPMLLLLLTLEFLSKLLLLPGVLCSYFVHFCLIPGCFRGTGRLHLLCMPQHSLFCLNRGSIWMEPGGGAPLELVLVTLRELLLGQEWEGLAGALMVRL